MPPRLPYGLMGARLFAWCRFLVCAAGALVLVITFTPAVRWTAEALASPWHAAEGDVLILLTAETIESPGTPGGRVIGESTYWRVLHAIYLWHHGRFRTILVSGEGSAGTVKPLLLTYGIPADAIVVENRAASTRDNAVLTKPLLAALPGRLVLLTSDYHVYRASRCFAKEGISVAVHPAPDVLKNTGSRVKRWKDFWTLASELLRIVYYKARGWI